MANKWPSSLLLVLVLLLQVACGDVSSTLPPPAAGTAPLSLTMKDTPPAGVTVLSFEVLVTSAVLQPGSVALVSSPIEIEVKRLETESAFLSTVNVPAGTYNSITVTFANPELTIKNDTGATLPLPSGSCAPGAVCEIKPSLSGSFTYSGAPFPLSVVANTPLGLLVDVNLNNIIQSDLSISFGVTNAFTVTQLPLSQPTGQLEEIEDVRGRVTAKDASNSQFTFELGAGGRTLTVKVDANTTFEDFDEIGLPNTFASLQAGQLLELDLRLIAGGMLLAEEVELEDDVNAEELEGVIVALNTSAVPPQFDIVLLEEVPNVAGVDIGQLVRVTLRSGTSFEVDADGLTIPTDLPQFDAVEDLLVGQTVDVRRRTAPTGTPPGIETDRVRLRMTRFTARVKTPGALALVVDTLPPLFTASGVTEIEVRASSQTSFEPSNLTAASLVVGDVISLRGLLFRRLAGPPVLVAKKVRKR